MFENNFIVKHECPKIAVQVCLNELIENGLAENKSRDDSIARRYNQFGWVDHGNPAFSEQWRSIP